jgi:carbon-monoxide dehydrogenase medium subunit
VSAAAVKPAPFTYHRATNAADAASLLAELGDEAKVLAGGQSLVPMLALRLTRFDHLIDLNRATDLGEIEIGGTEIRVGAMVRQTDVLRHTALADSLALLPLASRQVGHFQIRNRGTIGGSVAHADPAAEYPAVAVALDATIDLLSARGSRSMPAADFFVSTFVTAIDPDELLIGLRIPVWGRRSGFGVSEAARRSGDFAIAGAVAGLQLGEDDRINRAAIALFGVAPTPVRASAAEASLMGRRAPDLTPSVLTEVGRSAVEGIDPPTDLHGSAEYRRHLATVMVARAAAKAIELAKAGRSS